MRKSPTRFGRLDGLVHAIGYAPPSCLGSGMFAAPFEDVATAMHASTYSLSALVGAFRPLLQKSEALGGASVIALDFDGTRAYPMYDWMGVMKAALESLGRYLAREVGPDKIRVNMLAAGPIRTMAAKSIPGFSLFEETWAERAPARLGRARRQRGRRHRHCTALTAPSRDDGLDRPRRRRRPRDGLVLLVRELRLVEVPVEPHLRVQFGVRAAFDDPAVADDENLVGVSNR